jgi:hypothetical protein
VFNEFGPDGFPVYQLVAGEFLGIGLDGVAFRCGLGFWAAAPVGLGLCTGNFIRSFALLV